VIVGGDERLEEAPGAASDQAQGSSIRDGDRLIAATTSPEPTVGLVFYDLKTCLRSIDEPAAPAPLRAAKSERVEDAAP